jgi:hypothetical protein
MHARYRVKMDFKPFWLKRRYLSWALEIVLRRHRGYRTIDRLLTLNLFSMMYQLIIWKRPHWIPGFAKKSAMGVDVVFR